MFLPFQSTLIYITYIHKYIIHWRLLRHIKKLRIFSQSFESIYFINDFKGKTIVVKSFPLKLWLTWNINDYTYEFSCLIENTEKDSVEMLTN